MSREVYQLDYESPIGIIEIIGTKKFVCSILFSEREQVVNLLGSETPESMVLCLQQLDEYFKGERFEFTFPYMFEGTEFQKRDPTKISPFR